MSIRRQIQSRLRGKPIYKCALCDLTFETEREYCPACGSTVRGVDG